MESLTKKIVDYIFRLVLLCAIASAALAWVYVETKPRIDLEEQKMLLAARQEVLPQAEKFEEESFIEKTSTITYIQGYAENGEPVGKIAETRKRGYAAPIKVLVGVDETNKITKVKILDEMETPGLGARIKEAKFLNQFPGKTIEELKLKKDKGTIDAVTGATISSRATIEAVKEGLNKFSGAGKREVSKK
ncbi:MAG TPA: hypothetical protein DHV62_01970 [Elusimicrobia bacterium]|jgi:electron transport complex protein RnfG|nr:hypothetical protein [Elusimicrobiota bacterium]